jgi:hypothetical protein
MKNRYKLVLLNGVLVSVSVIAALGVGEIGLRLLDHFSLTSFKLASTRPFVPPPDTLVIERGRQHMQKLPVAEGVDRAWFQSDPTLPNRTAPDPFLAERYRKTGNTLQSLYVWNRKQVLESVCKGKSFFDLDSVYVFDSPSGTEFPRYRFPANKTLPTGLVTNQFGWRGPPLTLNRPPKTVRIAFVGASTTANPHGYLFSYPEYVVHWLNLWAVSRGLDVRFEVVNAGHEGTNSNDFRAIVRDELKLADPDLVIYYEGSNQFWPVQFVHWPGGVSERSRVTLAETFLTTHFAVARRISYGFKNGQDGREPHKTFGKVEWPSTLDEFDPNPLDANLPVSLPTIVDDLSAIDSSLRSSGAELVLSSFIWLAYDGMVLELPRQTFLFAYLNETFGPFPYAHMRRMADFQNRVFRNFAKIKSDLFIDVSGSYPQDSNLFDDAIHMNPTGIRLHAWIVLQQLIPIVEERLHSGKLPRPPRRDVPTAHPAQSPPALVSIGELKKQCAVQE